MQFNVTLLAVSLIALATLTSFAQDGRQPISKAAPSAGDPTIKGFVYDKGSGETLIGAHVFLRNSRLGCATNNDGFFVIPNVPAGRDTLVVTYLGYDPEKQVLVLDENWSRVLKIYLIESAYRVGEVVVRGDSGSMAQEAFDRPVSVMDVSQREVNAIPRIIEPDLLRALQTMPGITSLSDFSSAIYVRGGTPDQNLYLIDGAEIYNPEHAFGIFSAFNTNAIKKVEVSKGGFGAQYDDHLSSVINVINLDGNRNEFEGVANLSLIAAEATLQAPVGSFGSVSGSFRRTYIDQTYAKWSNDIPDYYFYDGNIKGFFQLGDMDNLTLSYFDGKDILNYQFDKTVSQSPKLYYDWGNTLGSANWKHIFSDRIFSSLYLTVSNFGSEFSLNQVMNMNERNTLRDYTAREALEYYASNEITVKTGAEFKSLNLLYKYDWDSGLIDLENSAHEISAYLSLAWKPTPLWEVEGGLRFEQYESDSTFTHVDPRLSIKYRLSEMSSLKLSGGIYHQYMSSIQRLVLASIWMSADKHNQDSRATHLIAAYNRQLGSVLSLETEVYYKDYKNIYIFNQNVSAQVSPSYYLPNGNPVYSSSENVFTRGDGRSYGLEILLRKDVGAVTGWVSYALSRTEYVFDGINQNNQFVPRQDRTSVVNLVVNGNVSSIFGGRWNQEPPKSTSNWLLGLNFVFTTGQPITVPSSAYYVNTLPDWNNFDTGVNQDLPNYKLYPGAIDAYRLPDYARLDLSLTWEKDFGTWTLSPYLQVFNIGNRKNVWFITYSSRDVNGTVVQDVKETSMLPILPTIGVTVRF